ncbi:glycosyltransferase family 4 protein [Oligella ureolytica]
MGKLSLFCSLLPKSIKLISLEHVAYNSRPSFVQWISQLLYRRIDQVITLTQNDKIAFDSFHSNVNVIANFSPFPVATEKKQGSKTIIAIGRLTEQKNYIHLLKAWEKIYEQVSDWKLLIYGDGEHEGLLNNYIKEQNLLNITLNESTQNITEVYSKANFFVMSSKYEGLPMVLIEAQSFGLPIVSYDCPHGPSDVITNGVNGFLVEDQNIDKLSEAMLTIIESKELQESMSQNSLINAKKYEPKEIINTWVNKVFKVEVN